MIGSDDKQRVLEPRLRAGIFEEPADSEIAVTDTLMKRLRALWENTFVAFGHFEGMMARSGEDCCHERLSHRAHRVSVELKELFVPDRPSAIKIAISVRVFIHTVILVKPGTTGISLESHRAVGSAMEESCGVAFVAQTIGNRRDGVGGIGSDDIGVDQHRNRREHRRHRVNRLATGSERVTPSHTLRQERIQERGVASSFVVKTDVLRRERLQDENDDIEFLSLGF